MSHETVQPLSQMATGLQELRALRTRSAASTQTGAPDLIQATPDPIQSAPDPIQPTPEKRTRSWKRVALPAAAALALLAASVPPMVSAFRSNDSSAAPSTDIADMEGTMYCAQMEAGRPDLMVVLNIPAQPLDTSRGVRTVVTDLQTGATTVISRTEPGLPFRPGRQERYLSGVQNPGQGAGEDTVVKMEPGNSYRVSAVVGKDGPPSIANSTILAETTLSSNDCATVQAAPQQ